MKKPVFSLYACAAILLLFIQSASAECLRVALHGKSFGKAQAVVQAIKSSTNILRKKYSAYSGDVSCHVSLSLCDVKKVGDGRLQVRMVGADDYKLLGRQVSADIHIVDRIVECPGFAGRTVYGCTQFGNYVVLSKNYVRGLVLGHELGHRYKMSWRTDNTAHTSRRAALMRDGLLRLPSTITKKECRYFRGTVQTAASSFTGAITANSSSNGTEQPSEFVDDSPAAEIDLFRELLEGLWNHGFPERQVLQLKSQDAEAAVKLRKVLEDPNPETAGRAVRLLAYLGTKDDYGRIAGVLEQLASVNTDEAVLAKNSVPEAMKILAERHQSKLAVRFLVRHTRPRQSEGYFAVQDYDIRTSLAQDFALTCLEAHSQFLSRNKNFAPGKRLELVEDVQNSSERGLFQLPVASDYFEKLKKMIER